MLHLFVVKSCFNHNVGLSGVGHYCRQNDNVDLNSMNIFWKTICKSILSSLYTSVTQASHISAMNQNPFSSGHSEVWNVMAQRHSLLLIGLSWHTAVLKQYPYCWDISIKVKKGSFCSDLLAALNGTNRNDIMHRFMVNQIPTEQRIRRAALQLTDVVGYCSSALHWCSLNSVFCIKLFSGHY